MGRPRQFDETTAIEAASRVFRQRGYAATSVDQLVEATKVHRGSLYGVFGSKYGLFLCVLEQSRTDVAGTDEQLDLLLVALLELAPTDPRVRDQVRALLHAAGTAAEQLGHRLLTRARIQDNGGKSP